MTEIIPGVHKVDGIRGANAYLIADSGVTVVDTGMGDNSKAILDAVKGLGYAPGDVKHVVITHCHMDHTGSVASLREATGAKVMIGEADADALEGKAPQPAPKMPLPLNLIIPIARRFMKFKPSPVDVRLKDGDIIPVLGGVTVLDLPGHSPGNLGLYCPAQKLMFSGDTLRMKGDDFIEPLNYKAEKAQCLASIKKMGSVDYEIMLSGHSPPILRKASKKVAAYAEKLSGE